jgi:arylsulfatase A-like enzyme
MYYSGAAIAFFLLLLLHEWITWKPNVILIMIDATQARHLGCYGYKRATSPDIDRIASKSFVFSDAIAAATWTNPSAVSLLSSTDVSFHGVVQVDVGIPPNLPLLPECLKNNGFLTAAFINQPGLAKPEQGFNRGFTLYNASYGAMGTVKEQHTGDSRLTSDALQWLKENRNKRFFVWLWYISPHGPYSPPPPYDTLFQSDGIYATGKQVPVSSEDYGFGRIPRIHGDASSNSMDVDGYIARYDGEIRFVNDQIRRILDYVGESGLLKKSILIITADHGESLGENEWYFNHGMAFESIIKVPLIISLPGNSPAKRIDALVSLLDLAPTMCDILKIQQPSTFEGKSLLPLMKGNVKKIRDYAFGERTMLYQNYLRTPQYKLTIGPPSQRLRDWLGHEGAVTELFDIQSDPGERHNLVNEKPEIAATLRGLLRNHAQAEISKSRSLRIRTKEAAIDENTKMTLRALGYLQ